MPSRRRDAILRLRDETRETEDAEEPCGTRSPAGSRPSRCDDRVEARLRVVRERAPISGRRPSGRRGGEPQRPHGTSELHVVLVPEECVGRASHGTIAFGSQSPICLRRRRGSGRRPPEPPRATARRRGRTARARRRAGGRRRPRRADARSSARGTASFTPTPGARGMRERPAKRSCTARTRNTSAPSTRKRDRDAAALPRSRVRLGLGLRAEPANALLLEETLEERSRVARRRERDDAERRIPRCSISVDRPRERGHVVGRGLEVADEEDRAVRRRRRARASPRRELERQRDPRPGAERLRPRVHGLARAAAARAAAASAAARTPASRAEAARTATSEKTTRPIVASSSTRRRSIRADVVVVVVGDARARGR